MSRFQYTNPATASFSNEVYDQMGFSRAQVINMQGGVVHVENSEINLNMQLKIGNLQHELLLKNNEIERLKRENNRLTEELRVKDDLLNADWTVCEEVENVSNLFAGIKEYSDFIAGLDSVDLECERKLPTKDPELLARMDGIYTACGIGSKSTLVRDLLLGYGGVQRKAEVEECIQYLENVKYDDFLIAIYSRVVNKAMRSNDAHRLVALLTTFHALKRYHGPKVDEVVDISQMRYSNELDSNIHNVKVNYDTDCKGNDPLYNKHLLTGTNLMLLHLFSHVDSNMTGRDIQKYHIGVNCRMTECSLIQLEHEGLIKWYKPIRVMGEYVILPTLPNERNGRVEAILHKGGVVPITLVRVQDSTNDEFLIQDSLSMNVNGLLNGLSIKSVEFIFGPNGLGLNVTGSTNLINKTRRDCCKRAFGFTKRRFERRSQ